MKLKNRQEIRHLWLTVLGLHSPLKRVDLHPHSTTLSMLEAFILLCLGLILIITKQVFPFSPYNYFPSIDLL